MYTEIRSRIDTLDGHIVVTDPTFDGGPSWDIPTLDQQRTQKRLAQYKSKRENADICRKIEARRNSMEFRRARIGKVVEGSTPALTINLRLERVAELRTRAQAIGFNRLLTQEFLPRVLEHTTALGIWAHINQLF